MLTTLAISGYRSLRNVVLPLRGLNVITGPSGSGKTQIWRAIRLLADCAEGRAVIEGGLEAIAWAGPESAAGPRYDHAVGGLQDNHLRLGFTTTELGYAVDLGTEINLETLWRGPLYDPSTLLEQQRGVKPADSLLAAPGSELGAAVRMWQTQSGAVDALKLPDALERARAADPAAVDAAVNDAFPGSRVAVEDGEVRFYEHGLRRPLGAMEVSGSALIYLQWISALLAPELPPVVLAHEPASVVHPDLLPPLARLLAKAAARTQLVIFTHSPQLIAALDQKPECHLIELEKNFGETVIDNLEEEPAWRWPA